MNYDIIKRLISLLHAFFVFYNLRYIVLFVFFFFKQKTAYEMSLRDWSSDVCSSDLGEQTTIRWRDAARAAWIWALRSEERRVGKECVTTCTARRSSHHLTKNRA